ncbi:TIGR00730 family Rossman fold protein [Candidatus Saccharibacteria bacterium]|nr:TIGR00730 family Rossman fold protein [Candidatus Saccharibacteria bacterium]
MLQNPIPVPSLQFENDKNQLLVRQRMIDAAEGRLISVVEEFENAFDILSKFPRTVTIFGSARLPMDHPSCRAAFAIAWSLAKHGQAIVTGGGHGVMEAANKGAKDAGGDSIGFNIKLPMEQKLNDYTTESYQFEHFFGRKVAMTLDANGYVYCGGGFGTLDELFEVLTLIQTGIVPKVPVILLGVDFWTPLDEYVRETMLEKFGTIDGDDPEIYTITDDIDLATNAIVKHTLEKSREDMFKRAYRLKDRWISEGKK